ncbi:MAG: GGDEF domain-containing protein [Tatlockia sp.]|nr:GGDEF domain-containing protein [Tatlockia sp.]
MKRTRFHLEDECFLLLLKSSLQSIPFNIFLAAIIWGYLIFLNVPFIAITSWFITILSLSVYRWIYCRQVMVNNDYLLKKYRTQQQFIVLTFLTGALWGAIYILYYDYFSYMHQNVITLVLGSLAAGALASLSVYLFSYCAYLFPMFIPLIIYNYWIDHSILATIFVLFVVMLIITAKFSSQVLQETIKLTKEKDKALTEIQRVSITDGLTGLYNRRYFDTRLNEEFRRAKRNAHSLNLVLIDVDDFKLINDNFGHPTGDIFLKNLARTIKNSAERANDTAFRIGGDEFAVILTNTTLNEALTLCNTIQKELKITELVSETTISIGLVCVPSICSYEVGDFIIAADKILYEAKKAGKNQIRSQHFDC